MRTQLYMPEGNLHRLLVSVRLRCKNYANAFVRGCCIEPEGEVCSTVRTSESLFENMKMKKKVK